MWKCEMRKLLHYFEIHQRMNAFIAQIHWLRNLSDYEIEIWKEKNNRKMNQLINCQQAQTNDNDDGLEFCFISNIIVFRSNFQSPRNMRLYHVAAMPAVISNRNIYHSIHCCDFYRVNELKVLSISQFDMASVETQWRLTRFKWMKENRSKTTTTTI